MNLSSASFQQEILSDYFKRKLNPFSSIEEDYKLWKHEMDQTKQKVAEHVSEYQTQIKKLQEEASLVESQSQDLVLNEVRKQQKDISSKSDLQEQLYQLCLELKKFDLQDQESNVSQVLPFFLKFLKTLKRLSEEGEGKIYNFRLDSTIKEPLQRYIELAEKTLRSQIQNVTNNITVDIHENDAGKLLLNQTILAKIKTEVVRFLNIVEMKSNPSNIKREKLYQIAREINQIETKIKSIWKSFETIENSILKRVHDAQESLRKNMITLKKYLTKVPEQPDNPCFQGLKKMPEPKPVLPVVGPTKKITGKFPKKLNPNFAVEFREKIIQVFPELQLEHRSIKEGNRCNIDPSAEYVASAHQFLVGLLLDPRLVKFRGFLLNYKVGSGKTGAAWQGIKTWGERARPEYKATKDVLILLPNESNMIDWIAEAERMKLPFQDAMSAPSPRTRYLIFHDDLHVILQVYTYPMDQDVMKKLVNTNQRQWQTFPFHKSQFSNQYSDFPNIYKGQNDLPAPFTYPSNKSFVNFIVLPVQGLIVADEVHHLINPQSVRGDVRNMVIALTWTLSMRMNVTAKLLLLTATILADPDRPLDIFKLLNLLKKPQEPRIEEGVWKSPVGASLTTAERNVINKKLNKVFELETNYVRQVLPLPTAANYKTAYANLMTDYSGMISYMSLEADPTIYPQVVTRCPPKEGCNINIQGCLLRYEAKKVIPITCDQNNPEICRKLRAIPVYITLPKKGKQKGKMSFTASEIIRHKFAVILDLLKQFPQEKHFIFTGSKRYNDFFRYAKENLGSFPYYDMKKLQEDLIRLPKFPTSIKNLVTQLYEASSGSGKKFHLSQMQQALLCFLPTHTVSQMQTVLENGTLYKLIQTMKNNEDDGGGGGKVTDLVRSRTNQNFLMRVMMELFNRSENNQGQFFQAFVADLGAREGLSLTLTRYVHFVQVPNSMTTLVQAIGRTTRRCSFKDDPNPENWLVRAYLYILSQDPCDMKKILPSGSPSPKKLINECKSLHELLNSNSISDELEQFVRSAAIDCLLFAMYTHKPGEKINCGLLQDVSEEDFRRQFMPGTTNMISMFNLPKLSSDQTVPKGPTSYGKVCVFPETYEFLVESEKEFRCDAPGEIQELTPYNEIDAFIYRATFQELDSYKEKKQQQQQVIAPPKPAPAPVKEPEKVLPPKEEKAPQTWTGWFQNLKQKISPYFKFSSSSEPQSEPVDRVSFQVMYPYLTCQSLSSMNKISYQKIYQDLKSVSIAYKQQWHNILDLKRKKTAALMKNGKDYVESLDYLATVYFSIITVQLYIHENLLTIKDNLRKVPQKDDLKEVSFDVPMPQEVPKWLESTASGQSTDKPPFPEIRYVLAEYDIDKPFEIAPQQQEKINVDLDLDIDDD